MIIKHSLHAGHFAQLFNAWFHLITITIPGKIVPTSKQGNWGLERGAHLPKATQLINPELRLESKPVLLQSPSPPYLATLLWAPTHICRDSIMLLFLSFHLTFLLIQGNQRHLSLECIHVLINGCLVTPGGPGFQSLSRTRFPLWQNTEISSMLKSSADQWKCTVNSLCHLKCSKSLRRKIRYRWH